MQSLLMQSLDELNRFRLAQYLVICRVDSNLSLPSYAGSKVRGGLGQALKQIACQYPDLSDCDECLVRHLCAYKLVFEGTDVDASTSLQFEDRPRGYVLEVSNLNDTEYAIGDCFSLGLVLVGDVIQYFPYILGAVQELGHKGLGRSRGRFSVVQAYVQNSERGIELIYQNGTKHAMWPGKGEPLSCLVPLGTRSDTLKVTFHTPTRIQTEGHLRDTIPFSLLVRTAVRRVSALNALYNGVASEIDHTRLFALAEAVITKEQNLRWMDWSRFSSRQGTRMKLGGVVGEVTYSGQNLQLFWPWLRVASKVHVGKNTTFGLGEISISWSE